MGSKMTYNVNTKLYKCRCVGKVLSAIVSKLCKEIQM